MHMVNIFYITRVCLPNFVFRNTFDQPFFLHIEQPHTHLFTINNSSRGPDPISILTIATQSPSKLMQIKANVSLTLVAKHAPLPRETCKTGQSLTAVQLLTQIQTLWTCLSLL